MRFIGERLEINCSDYGRAALLGRMRPQSLTHESASADCRAPDSGSPPATGKGGAGPLAPPTYFQVMEQSGWSYVEGAPYPGPWRYRWEAQEYADELNAKG